MINVSRKWVLRASFLLCLVSSSFALGPDSDNPEHRKCRPHDNCEQQVPEGGSAAIYLLAAGLTCVGAMFLRSRSSRPNIS
jgi:hypothetical protein